MRLYLAGTETKPFYKIAFEAGAKYFLMSFFYASNEAIDFALNHRGINLFIDSGGYSARVRGITIDVKEYIQFLKAKPLNNIVYANLDTDDPEESERNRRKMLAAGLQPMPVWHPGWPPELLLEYAKQSPYIGIGGIAGSSRHTTAEDIAWAVQVAYRRGVKVHLFGVTSLALLTKLPVYSADSTLWLSGGRFGTGISFERGKLRHDRVKDKRFLRRLAEDAGSLDYKSLALHGAREMIKIERFLTNLWAERGVVWDD